MSRYDKYGRKLMAGAVVIRPQISITPNGETGKFEVTVLGFGLDNHVKAVDLDDGSTVDAKRPVETPHVEALRNLGIYKDDVVASFYSMMQAMFEAEETEALIAEIERCEKVVAEVERG